MTEELGKAGWIEFYLITSSDFHPTGVRKPLFLVAETGGPHSFSENICTTLNIKTEMKDIIIINTGKQNSFLSCLVLK